MEKPGTSMYTTSSSSLSSMSTRGSDGRKAEGGTLGRVAQRSRNALSTFRWSSATPLSRSDIASSIPTAYGDFDNLR